MLTFFSEQYIRALFMNPQISFFINFFIKNGFHGTIYTFKNYFTTIILTINFQFQQNKSYPNRAFEFPSVSQLLKRKWIRCVGRWNSKFLCKYNHLHLPVNRESLVQTSQLFYFYHASKHG